MKTAVTQKLLSSPSAKTTAVIAGLALLSGCAPTGTASQPISEAKQTETKSTKGEMLLSATTVSEAARKLYMAGWADFENARFVTSHKNFLEAAQADPAFAMAYAMAARTAPSTESFVSNVKKASANLDGKTKSEQLVAHTLEKMLARDAEGATATAKELTDLHPKSPRAWSFLGLRYANTNDTDNARAAFEMATRLDATYLPGIINLGNDYLTQEPKDFAKAEKYIKMAVALAPNEPNPHDLLGDVHRAQNNLKAAYKDYTKAAELAPKLGSGLQQRGHVNSFLGNYDEARADYNKAAELEDARGSTAGPTFRVFGAYVNLHEGKHDAAMAELQGISDSLDGSSMAGAADTRVNTLYTIATIAIESGKFAPAEKAIQNASAIQMQQADKLGSDDVRDGAKARKLAFEGVLAARQGDAATAAAKAAAFEKQVASSTNPRKLEPMHLIHGMSAYQQGDFAKASKHLEQTNHVFNMVAKYYLARAHEQAGNTAGAAKLYKEMAVYNFNAPGYAMFRKDILARAGGS